MGHPQPPTPIHVDNTTTVGIVNNTIKRQHSRAMEMCYFWLLCQEAQRMFDVSHHPGAKNLGNYPSKAHSAPVCCHVWPYYIHMPNSPLVLPCALSPSSQQGCAETLGGPTSVDSHFPGFQETVNRHWTTDRPSLFRAPILNR